ncbi:hypothetical protein BJ138DRAFT_1108559 [Hygrophoropsis aurantiaca]|uniref:Uncharacterized protein n=1 Tax=Hygrophoropsis aurantiaca TaxID=72124 RepID=A0ACB8AUS6_9AGAM|nr:hypothetical protein BJ138DRAFT_1108559 [Hygrophoropsis aurantiaca]
MSDKDFKAFKASIQIFSTSSSIRLAADLTLNANIPYYSQGDDARDAFMNEVQKSIPILTRFVDGWPAEAYVTKYIAKRIGDLGCKPRAVGAMMMPQPKSSQSSNNGVRKTPRCPPCPNAPGSSHTSHNRAARGKSSEPASIAEFLRSVDPLLERLAGAFTAVGLGTIDELDKFASHLAPVERRSFFVENLAPGLTVAEVYYINNALKKRMAPVAEDGDH